MNIIKKSIAVLGYLLIISILANFDLLKLFDLKQIAVTFLGAYLLYIPTNGFSIRKNSDLLGYCALIASYIQTFVLLFFQFSAVKDIHFLIKEIAYNCRPLLYGFFLWVILQNKVPRKNAEVLSPTGEPNRETLSIEQTGIKLKGLGLTTREQEVAIQVIKGLSNAEIAFDLCISETTVKKHMSNIFGKLQITKREQIKDRVNED